MLALVGLYGSGGLPMGPDLRRSPRYLFFANAEITDVASEETMKTHTSELSRHGCYLDTMNPFFDGTALRVRIMHEGRVLDAAARVVHSTPNMGMGLSFDEISDAHAPVIEQWISMLEMPTETADNSAPAE